MNASKYSQPIARELVHRRSVAEVFITSVATSPATWICHGQLPRRHSFHTDTTGAQRGYYDPLLVLEAFRQACIAASHASYGVPLDSCYTVRYYELSILDAASLKCGPDTLDLEFHFVVRNEFRRGGDGPVRGLDVAAVVTHEGTKVMELSTSFGWMPRAQWEEFRADASWDAGPQASPADSRIVGRTHPENVVIGEPVPVGLPGLGGATAPIVVDLSHPTMFDHALDHLPGGLIIEACRQLSLAVLGSSAAETIGPSWLRCDFHSFAELDTTNTVTVTPAADDALLFRGDVTQSGHRRASVELRFATGDGDDGMRL